LLQHLLQILPRILQMGSLAVPNLSWEHCCQKMSKPYSQATIVAHNHNLWRAQLTVKKARRNM
jgi:hypothetical protein